MVLVAAVAMLSAYLVNREAHLADGRKKTAVSVQRLADRDKYISICIYTNIVIPKILRYSFHKS